ncbi:MAG: CYTH domain-containing protein [Candidatus Babeliales bacterium]
MIEVEIKVQVTDEQKEKLLCGATLLSDEVFIDTYYDSDDYSLTTKGFWLRKRNDVFELKAPATESGGFNMHKNIPMHEFTNQDDIAQRLNLPGTYTTSFLGAIIEAGCNPLYQFTNTRSSYKKNKFTIDFDQADFGDLIYNLCEIETFVESKDQSQAALDELYAFAGQFGISTAKAEGKLGYYIKCRNPEHYQALKQASEN